MAMLQCLDRPHRAAYVLGEIMEFSGPEAAEVLGISPALFRKRLQHARKAVLEFTRSHCGLVSDSAPCQCHRRVAAAALADADAAQPMQFACRATSFEEAARWCARSTRRDGLGDSSHQPAEGIVDGFCPPADGRHREIARAGLAAVITADAYAEAIDLHEPFAPAPPSRGPAGRSASRGARVAARRAGPEPAGADAEGEIDLFIRDLLTIRRPGPVPGRVQTCLDELLAARRAPADRCRPADPRRPGPSVDRGTPVKVWRGDITRLAVDAIVNAANAELLGCFLRATRASTTPSTARRARGFGRTAPGSSRFRATRSGAARPRSRALTTCPRASCSTPWGRSWPGVACSPRTSARSPPPTSRASSWPARSRPSGRWRSAPSPPASSAIRRSAPRRWPSGRCWPGSASGRRGSTSWPSACSPTPIAKPTTEPWQPAWERGRRTRPSRRRAGTDRRAGRRWVREADRVVIGAGSGLSAAAGLDFGDEADFAARFPALVRRGLKTAYQMIGYSGLSEAAFWGFWAST